MNIANHADGGRPWRHDAKVGTAQRHKEAAGEPSTGYCHESCCAATGSEYVPAADTTRDDTTIRNVDNGRMDANELRAAQAPVKEHYRLSGADALTPISATGEGSGPAPSFSVLQTGSTTQAGLHRAAGGDGSDACSGDMLLEAVLACAGVTLRAVAVSSGLDLQSVEGTASATFDARGTLGVDRSVPVGIQSLQLEFTADTDATDQQLERLAHMTERYCVVGQSLAEPPTIAIRRK